MWSDVVKGLKIEEELETTNSDKSGNESELTDSVEYFDSEEPDHLKDKQTRGHRKSTLTRRSRWVRKHQSHNRKRFEMGLLSRQGGPEGRGAQNRAGCEKRDWMGQGARARREDVRRSQGKKPVE